MAILVSELERWLSRLSSDAEVAIDEGGLILSEVGSGAYIEIGGEPNDDN